MNCRSVFRRQFKIERLRSLLRFTEETQGSKPSQAYSLVDF
jgi:hypothetical protein